jgi:hypothetical protein
MQLDPSRFLQIAVLSGNRKFKIPRRNAVAKAYFRTHAPGAGLRKNGLSEIEPGFDGRSGEFLSLRVFRGFNPQDYLRLLHWFSQTVGHVNLERNRNTGLEHSGGLETDVEVSLAVVRKEDGDCQKQESEDLHDSSVFFPG